MPDYFVPFDTSFHSGYFRRLYNQGIFNLFVLQYVDDNRKKLNSRYPDFNRFNEQFVVSDNIIDQFIAYAENEGLPFVPDDFEKSREQIRLLIKAYMARDLWDTNEYYQIVNTQNISVTKAVEILGDNVQYQVALQKSY
jgi:carboxyl-terminal processing protease